jgi:hypothetical protein
VGPSSLAVRRANISWVQLRVSSRFLLRTQPPKSEESGLGGLQCHSGYGAQGSDRLVGPDSSEKPLRLLSSIASCCTSQLSLAFEHPKVRPDSTLTPPARPCLSNIYKPNDRLGRRHSDPNCSTGCWILYVNPHPISPRSVIIFRIWMPSGSTSVRALTISPMASSNSRHTRGQMKHLRTPAFLWHLDAATRDTVRHQKNWQWPTLSCLRLWIEISRPVSFTRGPATTF